MQSRLISEEQLKRELQLTPWSRDGGENTGCTGQSTVHIEDLRLGTGRVREVGVIGQVEGLNLELSVEALGDVLVLDEPGGPGEETGPIECVATAGSEKRASKAWSVGVGSRKREAGGVDVIDIVTVGAASVADGAVRKLERLGAEQAKRVAADDRGEGNAGPDSEDVCEGPFSEDRRVGATPFDIGEWNDGIGREYMAGVEVCISPGEA